MKKEQLCAAYFPTTVVLIDDDMAYLHNLRVALAEEQAAYQLFDNPKHALNFLNKDYHPDPFVQRTIMRAEDNERGHHNLDVNVYPIRDEIYNPERFKQMSIVIIDQEMPGLKGLELCRALKDLGPVKKLMLTGEIDDKQAIAAFNEGLIHQFINKKEKDFSKHVRAAISLLQKQYFDDLSTVILDSMLKDPAQSGGACLADPIFIQFFNDLCEKEQISEYYLTDEQGSFMLMNKQGHVSILAIKDEQDMRAVYLTAQMADHAPSEKILTQLLNNELMLYTHTDADTYIEPDMWEKKGLLHPAKKLQGQQNYYYAYITDIKPYDIQADKILTFRGYLETLPID